MTTALDAIKSVYTSQYGGIISDARVSVFIDVWDARLLGGANINILSLPAVSEMCAFTQTQWGLLSVPSQSGLLNVFVEGTTLKYPDRFYCDKNKPCSVFDMWGLSSIEGQLTATDLYSISAEEYADRQQNYRAQYYDTATGKLADYVAPVVPVPLTDQAISENSGWIQAQISEAAAMGETFSDAMKAYVKAIRAIASGADTTSAALPARPANIFS